MLVLPNLGAGAGRIQRRVSLPDASLHETVLPAPERMLRVYGQIAEEAGMPRGELILQFVDRETGIAAQATDWNYRGYDLDLPPGRYQVRANLLGSAGGFQRVYDLGERTVSESGRWDLSLADVSTSVAEEAVARPQQFALYPNFPNPFNPSTTIRFSLPQPGEAELTIYNLLGQRVITLVRGVQEAGGHTLVWNGCDDRGRELASGVYFYRLRAGA